MVHHGSVYTVTNVRVNGCLENIQIRTVSKAQKILFWIVGRRVKPSFKQSDDQILVQFNMDWWQTETYLIYWKILFYSVRPGVGGDFINKFFFASVRVLKCLLSHALAAGLEHTCQASSIFLTEHGIALVYLPMALPKNSFVLSLPWPFKSIIENKFLKKTRTRKSDDILRCQQMGKLPYPILTSPCQRYYIHPSARVMFT
jgi:hypothetical protein